MNTELLAQAARDKRLDHGSVRLLILLQAGEPNPRRTYAEEIGVRSIKFWAQQLRKYGYIPPLPQNTGHRFKARETSHDCQNTNAPVPEIGTATAA